MARTGIAAPLPQAGAASRRVIRLARRPRKRYCSSSRWPVHIGCSPRKCAPHLERSCPNPDQLATQIDQPMLTRFGLVLTLALSTLCAAPTLMAQASDWPSSYGLNSTEWEHSRNGDDLQFRWECLNSTGGRVHVGFDFHLHYGWSAMQARYGTLNHRICLLYTSPSPRDRQKSRMPSSA